MTQLWHQLTLKTNFHIQQNHRQCQRDFAHVGAGSLNILAKTQVNFTGSEHGLSGIDFPERLDHDRLRGNPALPIAQQGFLGRILGGWGYLRNTTSSFPVSPTRRSSSPVNSGIAGQQPYYDNGIVNAFYHGTVDQGLRPYLGNPSAPITQVVHLRGRCV